MSSLEEGRHPPKVIYCRETSWLMMTEMTCSRFRNPRAVLSFRRRRRRGVSLVVMGAAFLILRIIMEWGALWWRGVVLTMVGVGTVVATVRLEALGCLVTWVVGLGLGLRERAIVVF